MKSVVKTPYEIRLELLQLATQILASQHHANAAIDALTRHGGDMYIKTAPTSEEIIAEAEKLNAFVSKANTH